MTITVLGAGAFGTALAISLSENTPVTLWGRDPDHVDDMRTTRENKRRLPGVQLGDNITPVADLQSAVKGAQIILVATPLQQMGDFAQGLAPMLKNPALISCSKGVDLQTGLGGHGILHHAFPNMDTAILTGPSFASDIARGLPTALTLATKANQGAALQQALSTQNLRIYLSDDPKGAELGGALKNVMAIACGVAMGAGLGESARAALITRGFAEMTRFAISHGAQGETLAGLSGFGDLCLTCTSDQSRNYRYGLALGKGQDFGTATVEGRATAQAVADIAKAQNLDMPITDVVADLVTDKLSIKQAIVGLMNRPLKKEI